MYDYELQLINAESVVLLTNEVISHTDNGLESKKGRDRNESFVVYCFLNYGQLIQFYDVYFSDTTKVLTRNYTEFTPILRNQYCKKFYILVQCVTVSICPLWAKLRLSY